MVPTIKADKMLRKNNEQQLKTKPHRRRQGKK